MRKVSFQLGHQLLARARSCAFEDFFRATLQLPILLPELLLSQSGQSRSGVHTCSLQQQEFITLNTLRDNPGATQQVHAVMLGPNRQTRDYTCARVQAHLSVFVCVCLCVYASECARMWLFV